MSAIIARPENRSLFPNTLKQSTEYFFGLLCGLAFRNHDIANTNAPIMMNANPISFRYGQKKFGTVCPNNCSSSNSQFCYTVEKY